MRTNLAAVSRSSKNNLMSIRTISSSNHLYLSTPSPSSGKRGSIQNHDLCFNANQGLKTSKNIIKTSHQFHNIQNHPEFFSTFVSIPHQKSKQLKAINTPSVTRSSDDTNKVNTIEAVAVVPTNKVRMISDPNSMYKVQLDLIQALHNIVLAQNDLILRTSQTFHDQKISPNVSIQSNADVNSLKVHNDSIGSPNILDTKVVDNHNMITQHQIHPNEMSQESVNQVKDLMRAIYIKDVNKALKLFQQSVSNDVKYEAEDLISKSKRLETYKNLLFLLTPQSSPRYIKDAYQVLHEMEQIYHDITSVDVKNTNYHIASLRKQSLHRMINALGDASTKVIDFENMRDISYHMTYIIQSLPPSYMKYELIAKLMKSMLSQKFNQMFFKRNVLQLWDLAQPFFRDSESFKRENYHDASSSSDVDDERFCKNVLNSFESLLQLSTYRKQQEIPFTQFLEVLVAHGSRPKHDAVLSILQNEYPYTNTAGVISLLKIILELQKTKSPLERNYIIDTGTMEHLSSVAARKGSSKTMMLLWDYINIIRNAPMDDGCGILYQKLPIGVYENTAFAFISSGKKEDHLAFSVLAEMEEQGYKPSTNLLRTLSQSLRTTIRRIDNALYILKHKDNKSQVGDWSVKPTTSSLNCVILAYAEHGMVSRAFEAYDAFDQLGCKVDSDTFGFLMEAIAINVETVISPFNEQNKNLTHEEWIESQLDAAEVILLTAREKGHPWTSDLVHQYTRVCCALGKTEKIKDFLFQKLEIMMEDTNRPKVADEKNTVHLKTFILLANSLIKSGKLDDATTLIEGCKQAGYASMPPYVTMMLQMKREGLEGEGF